MPPRSPVRSISSTPSTKPNTGTHLLKVPIEIVNIRLTGVAPTPTIRRVKMPAGGSVRDAVIKTDGCFFRRFGRLEQMNTAFYQRELLPVGRTIEGPAIILQTDTTTVVPPESTIVADGSGNLIIQVRGAQ